jgi:hypothetical protein
MPIVAAATSADAWRAAVDCSVAVLADCQSLLSRIIARLPPAPKLEPHLLLLLGLQAAALHQQWAGRSCIPADPIAAAGLSSSSGSSSGGSGGSGSSGGGGASSSSQPQQSLPQPPLLMVSAFHKSLVRQVPCLDLMLQQPKVIQALLAWRREALIQVQAGLPAACSSSSSLVPLLQVLVELAVLQADSPVLVHEAVMCMARATAGSTAALGLQPAQAAGLLAPVLHLLSAAVLHALGPTAQEKKDELASGFCRMVAAVVLPGALQVLWLAGCTALTALLSSGAWLDGMHVPCSCSCPCPCSCAQSPGSRHLSATAAVPSGAGDFPSGCGQHGRIFQAARQQRHAACSQLLELVKTVALACGAAVESGRLAAAMQDSDSGRLVDNHMLSLLTTCLKCCNKAGASMYGPSVLAVRAADAVADAALHNACKTGVQSGSESSSGIGSSCSITHWLSLSGRGLGVVSQQLMLMMAMGVLDASVGVRAGLGWQEGEVTLASAAEAAAVIRAAGSAAAVPATSAASGTGAAGPAAAAAARQEQEQVAAAAASAGGMCLALLCAPSEDILELLKRGSAAPVAQYFMHSGLNVLAGGLKQLAKQQQQQQEACVSGPILLQQLAQAAIDVRQQLDAWCNVALVAASKHYQPQPWQQPMPEDMRQCCTQAIQHNSNGIHQLRGSQGHALLDVLHHLQRLEQLGAAVCAALPPPSLACAHPGCANLSGLSDMQLVWRRGVCGHCWAARFCSVACLRAHWAEHRDPGSLVAAAVVTADGRGQRERERSRCVVM